MNGPVQQVREGCHGLREYELIVKKTYINQPQPLSLQQNQMDRKKFNQICKSTDYNNTNVGKSITIKKESPAARQAEARRLAMIRKKRTDHETRALRFHLDSKKFTKNAQKADLQADTHLEKLFEYPLTETLEVQTEFDQELFLHLRTGISVGTDKSTQVYDKNLFDFDTEVKLVAETLTAEVLKQTMREVLYEDELEARARQQRANYLRNTIEDIEKKRLEYEDERLNNVMAEHSRLFDEGENIEKTRSYEWNTGCVVKDINLNTSKTFETPEFVSWMMHKLKINTAKNNANDDILKNMIYDFLKHRMD